MWRLRLSRHSSVHSSKATVCISSFSCLPALKINWDLNHSSFFFRLPLFSTGPYWSPRKPRPTRSAWTQGKLPSTARRPHLAVCFLSESKVELCGCQCAEPMLMCQFLSVGNRNANEALRDTAPAPAPHRRHYGIQLQRSADVESVGQLGSFWVKPPFRLRCTSVFCCSCIQIKASSGKKEEDEQTPAELGVIYRRLKERRRKSGDFK